MYFKDLIVYKEYSHNISNTITHCYTDILKEKNSIDNKLGELSIQVFSKEIKLDKVYTEKSMIDYFNIKNKIIDEINYKIEKVIVNKVIEIAKKNYKSDYNIDIRYSHENKMQMFRNVLYKIIQGSITGPKINMIHNVEDSSIIEGFFLVGHYSHNTHIEKSLRKGDIILYNIGDEHYNDFELIINHNPNNDEYSYGFLEKNFSYENNFIYFRLVDIVEERKEKLKILEEIEKNNK